MSAGGPCYLCGLDPAAGYASVYTAETGERWYCHGDDEQDAISCYERAQWSMGGVLR